MAWGPLGILSPSLNSTVGSLPLLWPKFRGHAAVGERGGEGPLNPGSSWDLADVRGRFLTVGQEGRGGKQAVCGSDTCHQSLSLDNIGTDTQTYDEEGDGFSDLDDSDTCQ